MTGTVLERSLTAVAKRLHKLRMLRRQSLCWLLLLVPSVIAVLLLPRTEGRIGWELMVLVVVTIFGVLVTRFRTHWPSRLETAHLIEQSHPELDDAVLTAVRVDEDPRLRRSVMSGLVLSDADNWARRSDWRNVIPSRRLLGWSLLSVSSFCFMVSGVVAAARLGRDLSPQNDALDFSANQSVKIGDSELLVEPGDVEIERGSALTIVARFAKVIPAAVVLEFEPDEPAPTQNVGEEEQPFADSGRIGLQQLVMEQTVDRGVFAARITSVPGDGSYRVLFGDDHQKLANRSDETRTASPWYKVTTFIRPRVDQVDALITPPEYTGREPQTVEDVLRVITVEGSAVQLTLHLNKPVAIAELRTADGAVFPLSPSANQPDVVTAEMLADESRTYSVYLEDDAGRTAADEEQISIRVTRNLPPVLKITFPGRDTPVSPLQEFHVEAEAADDFGIADYGIAYALSGSVPQTVSLASADEQPAQKITMQHVIELETLHAKPDDLLTYYFFADTFAADGSTQRTFSDMMFAEVRPFEEIFRESQQQGGQQQQQGQQGSPTDELIDVQRQIVLATWNIQRSLSDRRPGTKVDEDITVVAESQSAAMEQLNALKEEAGDDPQSMEIITAIEKDMQKAADTLSETTSATAASQLPAALFSEQAAYQGLLRLRAREHQVQQSQSQQGQGQGRQNSAAQQQLNQLELDNDRNRYESESQAQQQQKQSAEQREQLQLLNRLKELARRQEMLNERLKQLESELRAAQTDEEREEIERELKRLREEQREMLRDVDELRERMDQASPQQQQQNQQSRQQIEQARNNVQRASEAMDEGKLAEAIAEGTRAERQFEELQENFRNQTSSAFSEAMRDLRQQARDLSEQQEQIAREIAGEGSDDESNDTDQAPSLRSNRNREGLQEKVADQRDRLEHIVEQSKQIVQEAESSEPLLSRRLYETIREMREKKPQEALEATEILVGRGLWNQSQQAEQIARNGIDDLQKGIERAADAVLGSEAESLRRASEQLDDLSQQLSSEIAEATGQNPNADQQPGDGRNGQRDSAAGEPGTQRRSIQRLPSPNPDQQQSPSGQRQPDEGQPGGQPGDSQRQPGTTRDQNGQPGQAPSDDQQDQQRRTGSGQQQSGDEQPEGQPQDGQQGQGSQPSDQQQQQDQQSQQGGQSGQQQGQQSQQGQQGQRSQQGQQGQQSQRGEQGQSGQGQSGQQGQGGEQGDQQSQSQQSGQQQGGQQQGGQQQGGQQGQSGQSQSAGNADGRQGGQPNNDRGSDEPVPLRRNGQQGSALLDGGRRGGSTGGGGGDGNVRYQPLTGDDFRDFSDGLRDVEEMLEDPDLRNRVAQVRDRARSIRAEFRRHGTEPQWDLVQSQLLEEMQVLQRRITQELARLESDRSMVPIDREPVPDEFDELVQRYYELLGQSRAEE